MIIVDLKAPVPAGVSWINFFFPLDGYLYILKFMTKNLRKRKHLKLCLIALLLPSGLGVIRIN